MSEERCKSRVWPSGSMRDYPCSRNAWKDGFCKQHHPDTVKARREKQESELREKRESDPFNKMAKKVKELEAHNKVLVDALEKIVSDGDYTEPEGMKRIAKQALAQVKK